MNEIYLVARGTSVAEVAGQEVHLGAGDMLVVEPGEPHTFVTSSDDYLPFVIQAPFVAATRPVSGSAAVAPHRGMVGRRPDTG